MNVYTVLGYVSLIPFAVFVVIHLLFCAKGKTRPADVTKLFLMPCLLLYYVLTNVLAATHIFWQIIPALAFSFLGDYFLLKEDVKKRVLIGIGSFGLAHLFYIWFAAPSIIWSRIPSLAAIAIGIVYLLIYISTAKVLYPHTGEYRVAVQLYTFVICAMSYFMVLTAVALPSTGTFIMATGSILFLISDALLSAKIFVKKQMPQARLLVMATYVAAQFLIVQGAVSLAPLFTL